MATHSSVLAWRVPWTEEPDGLQATGSQRVGHDCRDLAGKRKKERRRERWAGRREVRRKKDEILVVS